MKRHNYAILEIIRMFQPFSLEEAKLLITALENNNVLIRESGLLMYEVSAHFDDKLKRHFNDMICTNKFKGRDPRCLNTRIELTKEVYEQFEMLKDYLKEQVLKVILKELNGTMYLHKVKYLFKEAVVKFVDLDNHYVSDDEIIEKITFFVFDYDEIDEEAIFTEKSVVQSLFCL